MWLERGMDDPEIRFSSQGHANAPHTVHGAADDGRGCGRGPRPRRTRRLSEMDGSIHFRCARSVRALARGQDRPPLLLLRAPTCRTIRLRHRAVAPVVEGIGGRADARGSLWSGMAGRLAGGAEADIHRFWCRSARGGSARPHPFHRHPTNRPILRVPRFWQGRIPAARDPQVASRG